MKLSNEPSVADSFSALSEEGDRQRVLRDGSRVAVVGSGPAGSFFSYFLLKMADAIDLDVEVDIFEPRAFQYCGPAGCNHCGGIVSESLVQILAAEGIVLPDSVVQRGVESYVVHMDAGDVSIESPVHEQRIAALYRGNGPREGGDAPLESFDGYLQGMATARGARIVRKLITGLDWIDDYPELRFADGNTETYDLVAVATGVNSKFIQLLDDLPGDFEPPRTTRGYICEFSSTEEEIQSLLGNSVHVFLLSIPRFEFAAIIPKGQFATVVMVGDNLDQELVHAFLNDPVVRRTFPTDRIPCVCSCSPLINLGARKRPYDDRVVMIGDSGVTRWPTCRNIKQDNAVGKVMFATNAIMKNSALVRRSMLNMARTEQQRSGARPHMSSLLWNMFTGSAPYVEMFKGTLHPGFIWNLVRSLFSSLLPGRKTPDVKKAKVV
jgi:flavin-dependent dehydrogenase